MRAMAVGLALLLAGCMGASSDGSGDPPTPTVPGSGRPTSSPPSDADGDGFLSAGERPLSEFRSRDDLEGLEDAGDAHPCDPTESRMRNRWTVLAPPFRANTSVLVQRFAEVLGDAPAKFERTILLNATQWRTPQGEVTAWPPSPHGPRFTYKGNIALNATAWQMERIFRGMGLLAEGERLDVDAGPRSGNLVLVRAVVAGRTITSLQSQIDADYGKEGYAVNVVLGAPWVDASQGELLDEGFAVPIARAFDACAMQTMGRVEGYGVRSASSTVGVLEGTVAFTVRIRYEAYGAERCTMPENVVAVDGVTGRVLGYEKMGCEPAALDRPPRLPPHPADGA
jgi:hypothetical protein